MTQEQQSKLANHIFRLLKVTDISFPIGRTNKGDLSIKFTKDKEDFELILDAVPLNEKDYDNRELKSIVTKYLFDAEPGIGKPLENGRSYVLEGIAAFGDTPKKRGRPAGSKNRPQETDISE